MKWVIRLSQIILFTVAVLIPNSAQSAEEAAGPFCYCRTDCYYPHEGVTLIGGFCQNSVGLAVAVDYLTYLGNAADDLELKQLPDTCKAENKSSTRISKFLDKACEKRVSLGNKLNVAFIGTLHETKNTECKLYWNRETFKKATGYELKDRVKHPFTY